MSNQKTRELIMPGFTSEADMQANNIYAKHTEGVKKEYNKDKDNGLDINDLNSILAFECGYTPLANTVLIKEILEEQKLGTIILPDTSSDAKKAVVIVPGMLVTTLKKGDIISFKRSEDGRPIPMETRIFKSISFKEVSYQAIAGVFKPIAEMEQRVIEIGNKYQSNQKEVVEMLVKAITNK